jgi:hypothetical protein
MGKRPIVAKTAVFIVTIILLAGFLSITNLSNTKKHWLIANTKMGIYSIPL